MEGRQKASRHQNGGMRREDREKRGCTVAPARFWWFSRSVPSGLAGLAQLLALGLDLHICHELFDLGPAPAVPPLEKWHHQDPAPTYQPRAPRRMSTAQAGDTAEVQAGSGIQWQAAGAGRCG